FIGSNVATFWYGVQGRFTGELIDSRRRNGVRFAIKTRPEHTTWAELRDVWVAADDIELFESAWNWDHFYPLSGDLTGPNFEGWKVIIGLLSQETTTFDGEYYRLTDARCEPKPVQRPHPPIVIGGRGPKRTLGAVARWAQQWNSLTRNADDWRALKETLLIRC